MLISGNIYAQINSYQVKNSRALCEKYLSNLTSDDVILDVGCGTGETTHFLARTSRGKVTGIDLNPDMIQYANLNNYHEYVCYEVVDAQVTTILSKNCIMSKR